jgi:hypothetical protein
MELCNDESIDSELVEPRQSSRAMLRVSVRAFVYPTGDCAGESARVCHLLTQDISDSGISIIHAIPFSIGQRIELDLPDGCKSAVVCRTTALSDGHYLAGCRFGE